MTPKPPAGFVPPHPPLPAYYSSRREQPAFVRSLFNQTAAGYDFANTILSLGTGRWHRRQALVAAGLRPSMQVLDIATGTGLTASAALQVTGNDGLVVGVDVSEAMLAQARQIPGLLCVEAKGESLPIQDRSFDFISMGYALRHVPDLTAYFQECHRVLRPGGIATFLEIVRPPHRMAMLILRVYMKMIVPAICRIRGVASTRMLLDYYWATIEACVSAEVVLEALVQAGFEKASCTTTAGMFNSYVARKAIEPT